MIVQSIAIIGIFCIIFSAVISLVKKETFSSVFGNVIVNNSSNSGKHSNITVLTDKIPTLSDNVCSTSCCPSQFSCSGGCICLTEQQKQGLASRGNNARQWSEY